jgi:hypothetical protein
VSLTDAQLSSRRENGRKLGLLPKGPMTEAQRAVRQANGRVAGSLPKSAETRQKLRDANLGRRQSEETCAKKSRSHIGLRHSDETRQRISEAAKIRWAKQRGEDLTLNHKVVSVESLDLWLPVYDMIVPVYNNFAVSAGVFIHNSGHFFLPFAYLDNSGLASDMWTIRG